MRMKPKIFNGPAVTLREVLENKSRRAERQKALLREDADGLISFSLNIPGNIKQFPLARAAFEEGAACLRGRFGARIIREECLDAPTGSEGLFVFRGSCEAAKKTAAELEENHPLGRLFDLDVLTGDGTHLSRLDLGLSPRRCLICGRNAKECGRSMAHPLPLLREKIGDLLEGFFREKWADDTESTALSAMLAEVSATPKPGLVDLENSGSHRDMDHFTFEASAEALALYFRRIFLAGWEGAGEAPAFLFPRLRALGREAEAAMFRATGGVNTHKGLIFSMSLLCAARGICLRRGRSELSAVLTAASLLGHCALTDLSAGPAETNGLHCYRDLGIPGIRGEAAAGFPSVKFIALPVLKEQLAAGLTLGDASLVTLLALIAHVTDTNMIRRGGPECAAACRREATALLARITPGTLHAELKELDRRYTALGLSPGGCADLLALTLLLHFWT